MIALSLVDLAGVVSGRIDEREGVSKILAGPVVVDSRLASEGSIFIAMRGETTDGHEFAASAVAAGAAAVIAERDLDIGVPVIVVADSLVALSTLATEVVARVRALGRLRIVAVTGSNGKTTTKNMLRTILETKGPTVAPRGSFNNQVGAPLSMLGIDNDTEFLVVEMGASAAGDIARLVSIVVPDVAIVLKVGLAHAGGFGSIDDTAKAKAEIVTELPPDAVAVLNTDDTRVESMAALTKARVVRFGLSERADVAAADVETTVAGTGFTLVLGEERIPVRLRLLGEHNVMNALAAVAATRELGVEPHAAITALGSMSRAERWRMELLQSPDGITVLNDAYNASPDSMAAALKTLAEITRGAHRAIAVLGEMAELGSFSDEEHDRIGRLVVRLNIDKLVVVGHRARHIHNAAGLEGSWDGESVLVQTPDEAYDLLRDEMRAGDVVLVKSSNSAGLRLLGDRIAGVS
ncbi:UDP-N-acetylmuramoyl-tripeptide--D-alanyl-D-alanine ligase [Cryobacterium mesophilum]|uniref:UDP-N-acetylmuramoyl-tripeptide--D-alanyl-D-alanine ligase n=1 Tax=Terrimesophilobacter mesophilus TaxID=433647 RepID=A0A4R8V748_9MICO|nr:UDP-N-acetylmuramoyl-tripeptide--D-alanyl-D-alanine ligase [Terrimesophilobacter mesophilus]MBB5632048.1 UDP-N-acetylmuramoyl-tripeptide--D-alanyl-D-alanine ligase [Terrimesophilobacter mesophilus]TFB78934.1 UDP-N-acetylmuramoyl-tripeptide--D-alanyl-D-alanine ligase [Terrimesophilobacter mesophilus]